MRYSGGMSEPTTIRQRRTRRLSVTITGLGLLFSTALLGAAPQQAEPSDPISEELVVIERSILLQRSDRVQVDSLVVQVGSSLAEAVAVYPLREIEFPTTAYFDLCAPSFSRLTRAVGMVAAVGEQLLARGPVTVVANGVNGNRVLLESSRDALSFEAALTLILRSPLGGCESTAPMAGLVRLRRSLDALAAGPTAPSLLLAYGFDHGTITADELRRLQPDFAAVGAELAGSGRTTVVLMPGEGDRRLQEDEVRSVLPDPEGPPRVVNLGKVLGTLIVPKRIVPGDARILEIATDPRNELVRDLIAPGKGRLFAFIRQLEAFSVEVSDYQILFYRSRFRPSETAAPLVPIEVRSRSGAAIETVQLMSRAPR